MRTALFLLLLLAIAAVPGSLVPQRTSDPNGVTDYFSQHPDTAPILDKLQLFDVYTSVWFSAIYLLLFISLIGCVIPRTVHHIKALMSRPPKTPVRLERLEAFQAAELPEGVADAEGSTITAASAVGAARSLLRRSGYRVQLFEGPRGELSVSAERGYLRETGNLVFHTALIGVLVAVGLGGGFGYTGQRALVVGQAFANVRISYDTFNPGRFYSDSQLSPYRIKLDDFSVAYEEKNKDALGQPIDYTAKVSTVDASGTKAKSTIKVNEPLNIGGNNVYLLGNGYAPVITVKSPSGKVVFSEPVPFLPQDTQDTSLGVVKVGDGLSTQLGMQAFFYPTAFDAGTGVPSSINPDLKNPELVLTLYKGDLGINKGVPQSVYALNTDKMTKISDANGRPFILKPGDTVKIPGGLGTITFENADPNDIEKSVPRFVSFDIHSDPSQNWVLLFAVLAVLGLLTSLFIPRRRVWVKVVETSNGSLRLEYAGLARGEDPGLNSAVADIATRHTQQLGLRLTS